MSRTALLYAIIALVGWGSAPLFDKLALGGLSAGAAVVVGAGAAGAVFGQVAGLAIRWPSTALATVAALLIAALAARWLGSRLGTTAGVAQLTCLHVLAGRATAAEMLLGITVTAAMGAFALANVPGRLPLVRRPCTPWAFYAAAGLSFGLAGPAGTAMILAG